MRQVFKRVIGLDVHKEFVTIYVADYKKGKVWGGNVPNQREKLKQLANRMRKWRIEGVIYEATGQYSDRVDRYLQGPWQLFKINPADVSNYDGRKTDKRDAARLAQLLLGGIVGKQDAPVKSSIILDESTLRLRVLTRKYEHICTDEVRAANRLVNLAYQLELDFKWVTKDILNLSGQMLLFALANQWSYEEWETDLTFSRQTAETRGEKSTLTRCLNKLRQHSNEAKAALSSANYNILAFGLLPPLREDLKTLLFARRQKQAYFNAIKEYIPQNSKLQEIVRIIMSIRGVGLLTAVIIVAETGDFSRFATPQQYISWLGLNPRVSWSANKKRYGKMSKRGNSHIRRALYNITTPIFRLSDHPVTKMYRRLKKRKGPNSGNLARGAAMRKLAKLIFLLVQRKEYFRTKSPQKQKWTGVSAKVLPNRYIKRVEKLFKSISFDFPGSMRDFLTWTKTGRIEAPVMNFNEISVIA